MSEPVRLDTLEIVGYVGDYALMQVPAIVPPIFRLKSDHDQFFCPPYRICQDFLCGAVSINKAELDDLAHKQEITVFPGDLIYPAKKDFVMWVNERMECKYESISDARKCMRNLADEYIDIMSSVISMGGPKKRFDTALRFAELACRCDTSRIEPYIVITVLSFVKSGDTAEIELGAELVSEFMSKETFVLLVNHYLRMIDPTIELVK